MGGIRRATGQRSTLPPLLLPRFQLKAHFPRFPNSPMYCRELESKWTWKCGSGRRQGPHKLVREAERAAFEGARRCAGREGVCLCVRVYGRCRLAVVDFGKSTQVEKNAQGDGASGCRKGSGDPSARRVRYARTLRTGFAGRPRCSMSRTVAFTCS
ncbi:hypothetical protein B0H17DRAFT_1063407 [Mycena rosella]|uniref:Uncharacterized protein n=1 Tax=Mycena rosella TaxID=1033263 RepID=A0AAD7DHX9_MYCRO|nr:hypothetical protein B0H17DRAFT_1063407 [Mycena rosella]